MKHYDYKICMAGLSLAVVLHKRRSSQHSHLTQTTLKKNSLQSRMKISSVTQQPNLSHLFTLHILSLKAKIHNVISILSNRSY